MDKINEDIKKKENLAKDWKSSALLTLSNPREARFTTDGSDVLRSVGASTLASRQRRESRNHEF